MREEWGQCRKCQGSASLALVDDGKDPTASDEHAVGEPNTKVGHVRGGGG